MKSEKRKSSLPFAFGKKKESPASDEEGEKKASPFSKLRQTIKGKGKTEKPVEKPAETTEAAAEEKPVEPAAATEGEVAKTEETPAVEEPTAEKPAVSSTPVVAATA